MWVLSLRDLTYQESHNEKSYGFSINLGHSIHAASLYSMSHFDEISRALKKSGAGAPKKKSSAYLKIWKFMKSALH